MPWPAASNRSVSAQAGGRVARRSCADTLDCTNEVVATCRSRGTCQARKAGDVPESPRTPSNMNACTGILARCFIAFLLYAGGAALGADTEKREPQPDAERSASHVVVFAVPAQCRHHLDAGDAGGTRLSDAGSPPPARGTLAPETLIHIRETFPPVRLAVARFFDRVSYRTTGPPFQTI